MHIYLHKYLHKQLHKYLFFLMNNVIIHRDTVGYAFPDVAFYILSQGRLKINVT